MLSTTHKLFLEYLHVVIDEGKVPTVINNDRRHLALELSERIVELNFALTRVRELENQISELSRLREENNPSEESADERRARTELKVLTEAFYYCAARARSIARNSKAPLPGLASFECIGVRNVRNKLLEHPEGNDSQVFVVSFGRGGAGGPTIKPIRQVGQEGVFPDAGLYPNAEEFKANLYLLINRALGRNGPLTSKVRL